MRQRLTTNQLNEIAHALQVVKEKVSSAHEQFMTDTYDRFSSLLSDDLNCQEECLIALSKSLKRRFDTVIDANTKHLMDITEKLIQNCYHKLQESKNGT